MENANSSPARTRVSWRVWAVYGIVMTLFAVTATSIAGESYLRYREQHRATFDGIMPTLFYRHSRLGHALVRDFEYFGRIHIDREGFRGPEVALAKAPGVTRIMVVGSSTTFDPGVSHDSLAWPARLKGEIQRLNGGRPVEVINAGVPGYHVLDNLIRLTTDLYRYQPDLLILYEGHNDLFSAMSRTRVAPPSFSQTPDEIPTVTPWDHWLGRHSLFYGKLMGRLNEMHFHLGGTRQAIAAAPPLAPSAVIDAGAQQFERDLAAFLSVAQNLGIRVVVPELVNMSGPPGAPEQNDPAIQRVWSQTVRASTPDAVLEEYTRFGAVAQTLAGRFGATWIPTESFGLAGQQWYEEGDPIHFNDKGSARMAEQLARALVSSPAFPQAGTR